MLASCTQGTGSPLLPTQSAGALGTCMLAALLAWSSQLTSWATWYCSCQTVVLMLGCWLLSRNTASEQTRRRASILGAACTILRVIEYAWVGFADGAPAAEYTALLGQTHVANFQFCMYAIEGFIMQALLHQKFPAWASLLLGSAQAVMRAIASFRCVAPELATTLLMFQVFVMAQVSTLLPYQLVRMWPRHRKQQASSKHAAADAAGKDPTPRTAQQAVGPSTNDSSDAASLDGPATGVPAVLPASSGVVPVPAPVMPRLSSIIMGLLGSITASVLCAWRMGLRPWDVVQGSCQFSLFVLGCWLLPRDAGRAQPNPSIKALGITFTCLRLMAYARTALDPPVEYQSVFKITWTYGLFGVYVAESTLLQALWHRLLPAWACGIIGALQASLMTIFSFRLTSGDMPWWRVLHVIITPQVGMFAPYHLWAHTHVQQLLGRRATSPACASTSAANSAVDGSANPATSYQAKTAIDAKHLSACIPIDVVDPGLKSTSHNVLAAANEKQAAGAVSASPATGISGKAVSVSGPSPMPTAAYAAAKALSSAPYKSRLRVVRTVCVKLDTGLPCSALPADLAANLQGALRESIKQATSVSISDVAVRPGCICITMKVEQEVAGNEEDQAEAAHGPLQPDGLAHALLPELQRMLQDRALDSPAFKRSMLQVDNSIVSCVWSEAKQAWDVQARPVAHADSESSPWLGMATATSMRSASNHASSSVSAAFPSCGLLDITAEVQLWGVSKAADVEGWMPPQQHMDSDIQWPGDQQPSSSHAHLKLLARAHGGYLPTQVLRLIPGSGTDAYVTAQVVVQLSEQQLIRHHEGGTPSMLLLMDLELWQNEVLLSSSPLLSVPSSSSSSSGTPSSSSGVPNSSSSSSMSATKQAAAVWWWGASNGVVSAALQELEDCKQQCLHASQEEDASVAIQACVQYQQDMAVWLLQVQRVSCTHSLCRHGLQGSTLSALLRQPCLSSAALSDLGQDLRQYARAMGWRHVQRMVSQQLRNVVRPAAGKLTNSSLLLSLRTSVLGYPCQHDERLYKQQLAAHLRGMLMASSTASSLIGVVWGIRTLQWAGMQLHACVAFTWLALHLVALWNLLLHASPNQQRSGAAAGIRRAYFCIALVYAWRVVVHPVMIHLTTAEATDMIMQAFPQPQLWLAGQLVLVLTEQVPASVLLPAPWLFLLGLFADFPAQVVLVIRGSGWSAFMSAMIAFPVVVLARLVLDVHLRKHLSASTRSAASSATQQQIRSKSD